MATFGKYEVVTELHSGERGAVFSARAAGGAREIKYAVKTFNPAALDQDEQFWEAQSFTERARVQQRAAEAGGAHWAPVYEIGTSPAGTFYVTDFHPLSAASLVAGRVEVSAGVLYAIVRSVVAGLSELKSAAGRAHGNLKATNILINSRGDVAVAGAVLTDPAPAPVAAREGEAGDLYDLGKLIHLLVLGVPFPGGGGAWPLAPGREWSRLGGRHGRQWRRLCNDLLSPDAAMRPPGLDAVAKKVRRLVPRRARPSRRLSLAVAAVVVLVAAATATVLGVRDAGARREVCAAKERWAGDLTAALADPRRRTLLETDPDLLRVVRELDEADLSSFDCNGSAGRFGFNPNLRQFRQTQDTLDAVRRAERGLSPIQWRQLARAAELQGRFEARGWKGPAKHLADRIAAARPGAPDLARGIERFLTALAAVDRDLPSMEEQWVALQGATRTLDETRDPLMKSFAGCLRAAAAASVDLSDTGFGSRAGVRDALDRTALLLDAQTRLGPQYDEARFREEVVDNIPLNQVRPTDVDRYLAGMAAYKVKEEEIKKAVAELKGQAAANEKLVRASAPEKKELAAFESKLTIVNNFYITRFGERKFIERDFVAGEFAKAKNEVAAEIATLKSFVRMEDVDQWLARLEPLGVPSRELTTQWETWKENLAQTATQLAGQRARILELQDETRRLQDVLLELNRAVPQPTQLNDEVLARAADVKREEVLASLLEDRAAVKFARQTDPVRVVQESETVKAARAAYEQWTRDLVDLGKDFPLRPRIVTPAVRPDEQWAAAKPEFWNDRIVQTVVAADVERLRRMRALAGRPREELIKTAQSEGREELALHAWRLLATADESPPWPTAPGELATEAALRRRLAALLTPHARTDESAAAAVREVEQEGARRWRRFAEAAGADEAMLASAVELRGAFGIDAEDFASLAPEARFNLSLLEARRHGGGDDGDAALSRVVAELKAAAGQLKDRSVAAGLARRLARIDEKESFPDAARGDEFVLKPQGAPDVQIVFRRVRPAGGRPCFLATTELSIGHLAAVVDAAAGWDDLRSLVWSPQPGDIGDPRRGPRSWEWVMRPAPRMYPPQWWLFPEDANDFPKELRDPAAGRFNRTVLSDAAGGRPSDAHPVQYVTPEAAMYVAGLAGCRLPTPAEWRAAYEAHEKAVPTGDWNLRDQTWQVQQRHVASIAADGGASGAGAQAPPAPDDGIYLPPQSVVARGAAARALPHRDGTLFFRPVDGAGGATFRQLVGNVAELVCEASEEFEQLKDRRPAGIKGFAAGAAAGLFVVGGSALSPPPPEAPDDVPLPVKPGAAYADVGFRLAFTAPSRNLAEKLQWVLAGQGFVKTVREDETAGTTGAPPVTAAASPAAPTGTPDKSGR